MGGTRKRWASGSVGSPPDCCAGSSDARSLHAPRRATSASAIALRWTILRTDEIPRGGVLNSNDDVADAQEDDRAAREPDAGGNHRVGIAAVDERIDDRRGNGEQVEPEVELVRAHGSAPGSDPDLHQVDQARDHRKHQAEGDEPGG